MPFSVNCCSRGKSNRGRRFEDNEADTDINPDLRPPSSSVITKSATETSRKKASEAPKEFFNSRNSSGTRIKDSIGSGVKNDLGVQYLVNSHDDRPLIADLLVTHFVAIVSIRERINANDIGKELFHKGCNSERYDDIWILRFVLSHRCNVKSATKAALKTMIFREEKKLNEVGDLRYKIKNYKGEDNNATSNSNATNDLPGRKLFKTFCEKDAIFNFLPDKNRSISGIIQLSNVDMDRIVTDTSEEESFEWYLYHHESFHQVLDEITRRTGRLTKMMQIIDMANMQLLKMNLTYVKRDAYALHIIEEFYPEHFGAMFIFNSPGWLSGLWTLIRPLFPKTLVEKIDFLPSITKMKKSKVRFGSVLRYISEDHLPEKYGGMNKSWPLPPAGSHFLQD